MTGFALQEVKRIIQSSENIVFFGGAGVSTASNIPDFRSAGGLYQHMTGIHYTAEEMLSHDFLIAHADLFYQNLRENLVFPDAQPNPAHRALVKLEQLGKLKAVITQNIDSLHQKAGSKNVIELHGSMDHFYCMNCYKQFTLDDVLKFESVPYCDRCNGIIRPDIVLYQESLDQEVIQNAIEYIISADVFIIGGTSLVVYPAAGLLQYYRGDKMILINRDPTPFDQRADYVLSGDIATILAELVDLPIG